MNVIDSIYRRVLEYLAENDFNSKISEYDVSRELNIDIHLIMNNPKVKKLFELNKNHIEYILNLKIRDWLKYHFYYVHQGYKYNFPELQQTWLGKNIIKDPMDCWIQQEIIFKQKPDIIIESGVAFGGASYYYATLMDLIGKDGKVIGIDINLDKVMDINHPKIEFIKGSSIDEKLVDELYSKYKNNNVLVILDSNHERYHVLRELELYSKFIKKDHYIIVEDGIFSFLKLFPVPMEGPFEAVQEFLETHNDFIIDDKLAEKYLITHCPSGYLQRIK